MIRGHHTEIEVSLIAMIDFSKVNECSVCHHVYIDRCSCEVIEFSKKKHTQIEPNRAGNQETPLIMRTIFSVLDAILFPNGHT